MNCKNCNEIVEGNFCPNCGQTTTVDKINVSNFLKEISGSVFQVNKGLLFTIRELFVRPGISIHDYFEGKRKPFFKPLAYAFALSTLYYLISRIFGSATFIDDFTTGWANEAPVEGIEDQQKILLNWFGKNHAYSVLLLLPLFSLASYLAFRKFKFNFLEHVVLNAYITGQQAIFYMATSIFFGSIGESGIHELVGVLLSMAYTTLVYWQFFSEAKRVGIIIRTTVTYLLYLVISMLFTLLVFAILTII